MSHYNENHDSHPPHEDTRAQEARFLVQGLHQIAIDPQAEVPANFHATVMARAQQLPRPRKRLWDQARERLTIWAPVFATALLLSLGVHVWQGIRAREVPPSGTLQVTERPREERTAAPLSIYQFQARLQHTDALGALVAARPVPQVPRAMVGFTPHTTRKTFVRLGILYADTLAALHSGALPAAEPRLHLLTQALTSLQAPPALSRYLREMHTLLQQQPPADNNVAQFVALFEPLYQTLYASDPTTAAWVLFQAGAWLENLSLAAAVGDQTAVRQEHAVRSLHESLRPLNVPPAVLDALEQLRVLMARQPLTARDLSAIQALVDTAKTQLSE